MAGSSLLALIDDIATVLDDVAILSKVAAKKTAGVLGDDLALNAEQVSGVKASRELPVVWAVAKGSFINKFILVPSALVISAFMPPLITVLMVIGGLFLCYEGVEKVAHKFLHSKANDEKEHYKKLIALTNEKIDLVALENEKIKGAIRTDFILSAEIVVIVLGTVISEPIQTQILVVSSLALAITVGVYGLVAAIVKLDDLGLYFLRKSVAGSFNSVQRFIGRSLLNFAPILMKTLSIVGTLAMFLVGGGILVHSFSSLHHVILSWVNSLTSVMGDISTIVMPTFFDGFVGFISGIVVLLCVTLLKRVKNKKV